MLLYCYHYKTNKGIALYSKNYIKACEICRWFINTYPQDLDSYRLYMVIFTRLV